MYCVRTVTDNLYWVGANDHRTHLFENIHPISRGVSYNAYLLMDESTVLFDTVDWSVCRQLIENLDHVLDGRPLDYLVINHMEPDHGASIEEILLRWPNVKIISTAKAFMLMRQFGFTVDDQELIEVKEGDTYSFGAHTVTFIAAPMVHWPEAMVTFDTTNGALFSADAFGSFIALDGKLFADEVNFDRDWIDEARRYYQTACQLDPGNVEYRQTLNFVENSAGGYRPEGYEVFSSGCGGDNMCGRLACTYLLCNLCGCGGMRFFWC